MPCVLISDNCDCKGFCRIYLDLTISLRKVMTSLKESLIYDSKGVEAWSELQHGKKEIRATGQVRVVLRHGNSKTKPNP